MLNYHISDFFDTTGHIQIAAIYVDFCLDLEDRTRYIGRFARSNDSARANLSFAAHLISLISYCLMFLGGQLCQQATHAAVIGTVVASNRCSLCIQDRKMMQLNELRTKHMQSSRQ